MKSNKIAILFNPSAGMGRALREKERLESSLRRHSLPYDLFVTEDEDHLKRLTQVNSMNYNTLVGAGGDSTFALITNELMKQDGTVKLGLIGLGSSNDIVKEFGLDSLDKACAALKRGRCKEIDLGCIVQEGNVVSYFLGQANIGLGVFVNEYVDDFRRRHPRIGKFQTLDGLLGIRKVYKSGQVPLPLNFTWYGGSFEGDLSVSLFGNIRYWATGRKIFPDARTDDGLLDACFITAPSFRRLARVTRAIKRGTHSSMKGVTLAQAPDFKVISSESFQVQVDGEILRERGKALNFISLEFKIVPHALSIHV